MVLRFERDLSEVLGRGSRQVTPARALRARGVLAGPTQGP